MNRVTLDSWAVLHLLQDGIHARKVERALKNAVMSWVNAGEVWYIVTRRHGTVMADEIVGDLRRTLGTRLLLPDEALVLQAASIKSRYRMAYADAFAAATALSTDTAVMTADPELLVSDRTWKVTDLSGR